MKIVAFEYMNTATVPFGTIQEEKKKPQIYYVGRIERTQVTLFTIVVGNLVLITYIPC